MKVLLALIAVFALLLASGGCGGGGGGGSTTPPSVTGRVLNVATGGATNPQSSVQIGANSDLTDVVDGSFSVVATLGASSLTVDTMGGGFGTWLFNFPPITGTTDVGDLWVGPERVTVTGVVRNSATNDPVPNAEVTFGGRIDITDANGVFVLTDVAYSSATQTSFWGIAGRARATGFTPTEWSAQPNIALAGTVTVDDILLAPLSDPNPPGPPFNVWGRVSPAGVAAGTIATLKENGTPVRVFNVGSDALYKFWIGPGTYTIDFVNGSLAAHVDPFTITLPNQVLRFDVTLQ